MRSDFLSATELAFFRSLGTAVRGRLTIAPKVNVADLLFSPVRSAGDRNRISQKHVDFVLCEPESMRPVLGIELDDSSHGRQDRAKRDDFLNAAFAGAKLPLVRFPARARYESSEIAAAIDAVLPIGASSTIGQPPPNGPRGLPTCPNCGVEMVMRVAGRGSRAGSRFYGCPNYPRCREIAEIV